MRIDDILDENVSRPGDQSRGAGSDRKASFFREQRAGRETSGLTTKARRGLAPALIAPVCGFRIKFGFGERSNEVITRGLDAVVRPKTPAF